MENASKALIMAGSVLIALMIIGALILMFNSLTSYQETNTQNTKEAQIVEFNNKYETYNRKDVRGSDLISLVNRIIDYNKRKTEEGYKQMNISITINNPSEFAYNKEQSAKLIKTNYTQNNLTDLVGKITNSTSPKGLENKYGEIYIRELSSNISNIMYADKGESKAEKILPKPLNNYGSIEQIRQDTLIYYEYSQFKRGHFECIKTQHDENTGRIINMEFKFIGKFN